jgi:predicted HTH domain antitoxin
VYHRNVPTAKENIMQTISVRQLKSNPSTALRDARTDMVVVMNRDKPDAVMIGFEQLDGLADFAHVRQAMAVSLFKDRLISVAGAAKMANETLGAMLTRLARLGVPVADYDTTTLSDEVAQGANWLQTQA